MNPVRNRVLFGKSKRRSVENDFGFEYWGTRNGKFVRVYYKELIRALRIELQMRSRFLRPYMIKDVFDFWKLLNVLPGKHIFFGRIDEQKLICHLRRTRSAAATLRVLEHVTKLKGDLDGQMRFLRQVAGLQNTRRLLIPLPENEVVMKTLQEWAAMWPKGPAKLGAKK